MLRRSCSIAFSLAFAGLASFSANAVSAADSTWSFRVPVQLQYYSDDDNDYHVIGNLTTTEATIPNGITSVGNSSDSLGGNNLVFSLTGQQYDDLNADPTIGLRAISLEDAHLNQPYNPTVDRIDTGFNFGVILSGGVVNMYEVDSDYSLINSTDDLENVGSEGYAQIFTPGQSNSNFAYVDDFTIPNASDGTDIVGDFTINFTWSGYSPTDTLEFSFPDTGVTIQQVSIPEPTSLSLLAAPALLALRRRRA
ncbi:MAG TPA: hypothetical protein VFE58_13150 [Tepidisphaeraceae bacterium]|jgi:hypothetical protein|nr:hypothetical protein [Tepidisphaeraceae bacterium]